MDQAGVRQHFDGLLKEDPSMSEAMAAIRTLLEFIRQSQTKTMLGLRNDLNEAIETLTSPEYNGLVTAMKSGCELFLRFITLCSLDNSDFEQCKRTIIDRGDLYIRRAGQSREKIARLAHPFVTDGSTIITHSRSRVVLQLLQEAAKANKRFKVYITESMPDRSGELMKRELLDANIDTVLILDSAVGSIMEKVDMVLFGAEGVVESGGIINKIGTYTIAICAKAMNKPVYVVAESFKFTRIYPLNQDDVPREFKYPASRRSMDGDATHEHPLVDYTPPAYLTLLFTDLGILTPSAVSDELIKLYL